MDYFSGFLLLKIDSDYDISLIKNTTITGYNLLDIAYSIQEKLLIVIAMKLNTNAITLLSF